MTPEDWTHSMGGVGQPHADPATSRSTWCGRRRTATAEFDDGVDAPLEVAVLAGLDPDCSKTPIAASAVAELIR